MDDVVSGIVCLLCLIVTLVLFVLPILHVGRRRRYRIERW